jgi:hypothetical protein
MCAALDGLLDRYMLRCKWGICVIAVVAVQGPDDEPLWQQLPRLLLEPGTGQKVVASVPWPTLTE